VERRSGEGEEEARIESGLGWLITGSVSCGLLAAESAAGVDVKSADSVIG
jgi:hypothetical protein